MGCVEQWIALYQEVLEERAREPRSSRRREARSAAAAVRAVEGPLPLRKRIRRIAILCLILVMIKRALRGPRIWR
jgi:hypothetical protein